MKTMSITDDKRELAEYNLQFLVPGQFAVIQIGYAGLGFGETADEALASACECMGEQIDLDDLEEDGAVIMVEIVE